MIRKYRKRGGASSPGAEGRVQSTMCHRDSTLDHLVGPGGSAPLSEERYRAMLSVHKKRRLKRDDHPELDIANITLHDISVRTQLASGHRRPIPSRPSSQLNQIESKAKKLSKTIKTEPLLKAIPPAAIYKQPITEISEPKLNHITQNKINVPAYNDYTDSENDSIIDPVENIVNIKPPPPVKKPNAKRRSSANSGKSAKAKINKTSETSAPVTSLKGVSSPIVHAKGENITISHDTSPIIPQKQLENKVNHSPVKAATLSDLEGINMMQIPIDFDDSNIDILDELNNKTPELMQETHVCFLSLIRDIICSTADHRIRLDVLDKHLTAWQDNPISPLNDWYSVTESWVAVLPSAINFLTGDFADQPEDFVPYLEYKPTLQMYQWIGAGRDTDNLLVPLCQYWLDRRNNMTPVQMSLLPEPDLGILERPQTPPPPRWPTLWKVRKAEPDEVAVFREQERVRYENPHKAFTYRMHGYESIVAPIKGIYNQSTGVAKARGHSMLNADRPNFVTILTLVRDATARLPNGEGTRADICELLRCSQYISSTAPDSLLQSVVSGALDRMHTEYDPCVKYDPKKKIWIYLHRSRTESEFEKIHQQIQAMGKLKKNLNRKTSKPKAVKPKAAPIKAESVSLQDTYMENKQELESGTESSAILNKVIQPQIQQMMMKQQQVAALHQLQKHLNQAGGSVTKCGTSLLGPNAQRTAIKGQTQQPLVAKVVTNASGQVFSLESILSKQANVIPQGVSAIRVGTKQPQSNQLIQLSGGSSNQVQQYAVVSQGNLISVGAPRLTMTSQVSNAASIQQVPTAITRVATRPVLAGKPNQKIIQQQLTQQIVNAKLLGIQNQQGKIITAQAGKPGLVRANLKPGTGGQTIRMVNTAGLNIATIAGKPVILASKNNQIQGQNVIIQSGGQNDSNTNLVIGGQTLKVPQNLLAQGNVNLINTNLNQQSSSQTTVMLGGQVIKVQSGQSGVSLSQPGVNISQTGLNVNHQQTVMLGGQTLKVQSSTPNSMTLNQQSVVLGQALKVQSGGQVKTQVAHQGQRVVLASQGQGGQLLTQQILLPPGFQGGAINIKTLQGLKVIPIAQQTKGI